MSLSLPLPCSKQTQTTNSHEQEGHTGKNGYHAPQVGRGGGEEYGHERNHAGDRKERRIDPRPDVLMGAFLQDRLGRDEDQRIADSENRREGPGNRDLEHLRHFRGSDEPSQNLPT